MLVFHDWELVLIERAMREFHRRETKSLDKFIEKGMDTSIRKEFVKSLLMIKLKIEKEQMARQGGAILDEIDKSNETTAEEFKALWDLYHAKCDEYRELMLLNGKLRGLLADNGIDHEF